MANKIRKSLFCDLRISVITLLKRILHLPSPSSTEASNATPPHQMGLTSSSTTLSTPALSPSQPHSRIESLEKPSLSAPAGLSDEKPSMEELTTASEKAAPPQDRSDMTDVLDGTLLFYEPLNEFTYFERLPKELQLRIWNFTLPGPRTIEINNSTVVRIIRQANHLVGEPVVLKTFTKAANPMVLFVNRETRVEALKKYHILFPGSKKNKTKHIYFDPDVDKIAFDDYFPFQNNSIFKIINSKYPEALATIKSLEIRHMSWDPLTQWDPSSVHHPNQKAKVQFFRYMTGLEKVEIRMAMPRRLGSVKTTLSTIKDCRQTFHDIFSYLRQKNPAFNVPNIQVRTRAMHARYLGLTKLTDTTQLLEVVMIVSKAEPPPRFQRQFQEFHEAGNLRRVEVKFWEVLFRRRY
ncbi:hypothetical protein B7494_g970 [Chlorociboria aeruginascens]|nr:hypothetical protein B7494_g970 [Chlorociboria aeruginascens]